MKAILAYIRLMEVEALDRTIVLHDSAIQQMKRLIEKEDKPALILRVSVFGGGCSGFQYQFSFDEKIQNDDIVFEKDGVKLVTDEASLDLLAGSEIHYVQELIGSAFTVKNPNAASSCGCGTSFSI